MAKSDKLNQLVEDTTQKTTALEAKIDETVVTLQELKAIVGNPTTDAESKLETTNGKLDELLARLGAAEADADPTPDA